MEIGFESKSTDTFREIFHQVKRIQESTESVVPDTDEDIEHIASVQTAVYLKSKDVSSRGVIISGEAVASVLYIAEGENTVSFVKLGKTFSIEYEIPDISAEAVAQISLAALNTEARVINPRKLAVNFEISGELSCYKRESIVTENILCEKQCAGLHARYESREMTVINSVSEKTFAINEQFVFPSGKPRPEKAVSAKAEIVVGDTQLIGSKLIIKGSAEISVCYLSDEVNYPVKAEFTTPYSQIIDIGEERMELCCVNPEITGVYYDIMDTINGDKALDIELHAVMQTVTRCRCKMVYAADAYCNTMPASCAYKSTQYQTTDEIQKIKLTADERINIIDDCADVLSAFVSVNSLTQEQSKLSASVGIDIVYRTAGGQLSSVRRNINMQGESSAQNIRISNARLTDVYLRPDGQYMDGHLALELNAAVMGSVEIRNVCAVELDEENYYDLTKFPSLTLVRAEGESAWELAKAYHSSVEKIEAANQRENDGGLLLIPKCI